MAMKLKKVSVGIGALVVSGTAAWASCGGTEALVSVEAATISASLVSSVGAAAAKLMALDEQQTEMIVSSLAVLTKQLDASSEKLSSTTIAAEQSSAAVAKELADKEMIDKLVVDYTSQGYEPCLQSDATNRMSQAERNVYATVPNLVRTEVEGINGRFASVADAVRMRDARHREMFCTQAEVDAGVCSSLGKIPGGDVNGALLFSSDASSDMRTAKNAFINQVVGLPDDPLRPEVANTPTGQAYILEKKRKDAFLSFPAYSLKTIQTENEVLKPAMDARVGQYFGTAQAAAWAKSQTSQAQRGLLVDMVKMQGLNLKLAERRLRQNMRIETNLAALLELENQIANGSQAQSYRSQTSVGLDSAQQKVN